MRKLEPGLPALCDYPAEEDAAQSLVSSATSSSARFSDCNVCGIV